MSNDISLPAIPDRLVVALDKKFPHRCPNPKDSEREIWMKAGERRVVDFLIEQFNRQNEVVLEN